MSIRATLDKECKPYQTVFSQREQATSMGKFAFAHEGKRVTQRCSGSPHLQEGSLSPYIAKGERPEALDRRLTAAQYDFYDTPAGITDLNAKGIRAAIDMRVALFFQQAVLCHRMPLTFSYGSAEDQVGNAPSLKLTDAQGRTRSFKRQAAHSSTLPALLAKPKNTQEPSFVYLKGGSSYWQQNTTVGMSLQVNQTDSLLDGAGGLRDRTIKILNRVAEGLDPIQASQKFMKAFLKKIAGLNLQRGDARRHVLELYKQRMEKIQLASQEENFYDHLLGVVLEHNVPNAKELQKVVYQKRYDIIRLEQIIESRIAKRIAEHKEILYLEHILLKRFSETSERMILEKLFGKTAAFFEQEHASATLTGFKTRISNLEKINEATIAALMRDLRADFRELSCAEFTYRAGLFKDLRTRVHHWTQKEFCRRYPVTISQAWVSRMEQLSRLPSKVNYKTALSQRRRYIRLNDVQRCADTFGVSIGVLLPALITSFK